MPIAISPATLHSPGPASQAFPSPFWLNDTIQTSGSEKHKGRGREIPRPGVGGEVVVVRDTMPRIRSELLRVAGVRLVRQSSSFQSDHRFYGAGVAVPHNVPFFSAVGALHSEGMVSGFFLEIERDMVSVGWPLLRSVRLKAVLAL